MNLIKTKKQIISDNKKEKIEEKCNDVMNSSTIYDRNFSKTKFKELYDSEKYDFPIKENFYQIF